MSTAEPPAALRGERLHEQRRRRQPRAARACNFCRVKKNKCDELFPCTFCKKRNVECRYHGQDTPRRPITLDYVRQLEDRVDTLSNSLMSISSGRDTLDAGGNSVCSWSTSTTLTTQHHSARVDGPQNPPFGGPETTTTPSSTATRASNDQEVTGVNRYTHNTEFYGNSSSVAILSQVQRTSENHENDDATLVSSLHNPAFYASPHANDENSPSLNSDAITLHHFSRCRGFLYSFFSNLHYVHPILDKSAFLARCDNLWTGKSPEPQPTSFTALYYSVMSLGALVGTREEENLNGLNNMQWSRHFFNIAKAHCNDLGMVTDLEMVQCYFILAKVCQNELNPHWSYIYLGLAVRTALAMGINREPSSSRCDRDNSEIKSETRTWWSLYSLDTELSFAMGRPDSLGADLYHNRHFPITQYSKETPNKENRDPSYCGIIREMVDFSRITRRISHTIYLGETTPARTAALTQEIEKDLEAWTQKLPDGIQPHTASSELATLERAKDPLWARRQRLVLTVRYHNIRMMLFASFLLKATAAERKLIPAAQQGIQKCLDSARLTIDIIYQTLVHNDFFKTWFYNVTYTVFAAAIILVYVTQEPVQAQADELLRLVHRAVEVLEIMDECVVALEAARLLRHAKEKTERTLQRARSFQPDAEPSVESINTGWSPLRFTSEDMDFDAAFHLGDFDGGNIFTLLEGQVDLRTYPPDSQ